ncbi:MAG: hypothetical protein IJE68_05335 [Clostridia bacterium]|nr:hypothetical protein [Clostridia bacterium]
MNVIKEQENKNKTLLKIFYISIIAICIISIIAALMIQIANNNEPATGETTKLPELTNDKISQYKEEFNNIFENKVNYLENNRYKISKIKEDEEIVYIGYKNHDTKSNDYEVDVNIPYINIQNETIKEFNEQIKEIFETKAKSVLNSQNNNIIYTVDYSAYISNNILSLVVRSTLKEGANAQRDIVQTYNYDLANKKKCTIDQMLELKGITKKEAGQKIRDEIKTVQERVEELRNLGYNIYARDYTSDIYSVNNITDYFMGKDNALYIIYAYGNENHTSEMDIVVM